MILFIDDEETRSLRWREALPGEVEYKKSAAEALAFFADAARMQDVRLVIVDLAMYTTGDLTDADTGFGRLTGMALRRRLRQSGWRGPVIVLSNSRDDGVRGQVEAEGDRFLRKPEHVPANLRKLVDELLDA